MQKYKLVVFVPLTHSDDVRKALGDAGAGVIGDYSDCSFSSKGVGRFIPKEGADPFIGKVGEYEQVEEERIEVLCTEENIQEVITKMKEAHPYEEVAYDVYKLEEF